MFWLRNKKNDFQVRSPMGTDYPPKKLEGYSFGFVCPSRIISQYLLVRLDAFLL